MAMVVIRERGRTLLVSRPTYREERSRRCVSLATCVGVVPGKFCTGQFSALLCAKP